MAAAVRDEERACPSPQWTPWAWALAVSPVVLLVGLVLHRRGSTAVKASAAAGVAVDKSLWTGGWILYVI